MKLYNPNASNKFVEIMLHDPITWIRQNKVTQSVSRIHWNNVIQTYFLDLHVPISQIHWRVLSNPIPQIYWNKVTRFYFSDSFQWMYTNIFQGNKVI